MRRALRAAQIVLLALAVLYAGDFVFAQYRIPGNRQIWGSVEVRTLYAVRLKNRRIEYSVGETATESCVRSLFPQLGYSPCWYLRRHATKYVDIGEPIGVR